MMNYILLIYVFLFFQFSISIAQESYKEYLIKLPDTYFKEIINKSITDISYNQQYFETIHIKKIHQIYKGENNVLKNWLLVKSEKDLTPKFTEIKNKGKLQLFQKNHRLRIQSLPNDSLYHKQWYHRKIMAAESWQQYTSTDEIILTVIDTGVDYNHPDLINCIWINKDEDLNGNGILDSLDINNFDDDGNGYVDDVIGWDFTDAPRFPDGGDYLNPDNDPMDEYQSGHGTQIAGIIAARANNYIGIAGVTPQIKVMNLRAGTASGYLEEDDVAAAIIYAIENGSRVINMSFGDIVVSAFLKDVIRYAYSRDIILVASAGNSGTNEQHYPSGFAETISVGATDSLDVIAGFSSWGQTLDITAPGKDILATKIGGGYNYSNGTSFSAPMVAAASAFLLGNHPQFSNEQIRNILKSASDDKGNVGWDEYYGSGRLNLLKASLVQQESELNIEFPASGSFTALDYIPIVVTIQDADLQNASLFIGEGQNPSDWTEIVSNLQNQIISDTLTILNLTSYADTTIILRLIATTWQGQVKEYRSVLYVDKSAPVISNIEKLTVFDENQRAMLISFHTDDVTRGELRLRHSSSTNPYIVENLKYETQNHKILINSDLISGNIEFEIRVENLSGLETTNGGLAQYEFYLSPDIIPAFNFTQLNYTLPKGYLLPKISDFDNDGNQEIILSLYDENNSFGNVCIFEFEGSQFEKRAETAFPAIPRDFGDADNDGKMELLLGFGRTSYVMESSTINGFPDQVVWKDTLDFWVSRICDMDNDGINEILGKSGNQYKLMESTGDNSFAEVFSFINPTDGNNALGPPTTTINDFDADSHPDLIYGDYDGDLIIYENISNNSFANRLALNLPLTDATDWITSGNFISTNTPSFVIGTHTDESANLESEFDARIWSFFHYESESNNVYSEKQRMNIFGYADVREFDSGISTGKEINQNYDYLMISAFPDLYIFQSNGDSLVPIWYYNGIQSNKVIINDYDKNGAPEIYFNNGKSIVAYEFGESSRPLPPGKFSAVPLDTTANYLSWQVSGGSRVIIWRGLNDSNLMPYDSVYLQSNFTDISVLKDSTYSYALQLYDDFYVDPYSNLSGIQKAKPNVSPQIDTVFVVNENQIQLFFNEQMLKSSFQANNFKLLPQNKYASSAIAAKNAGGVLLTFPINFSIDTLNNIETSQVRDIDKTLLDSGSRLVQFYAPEIETAPYIENWEMPDRFSLEVTFSLPMDNQSIFYLDNYKLEPEGEIIEVNSIDSYNKSFALTLSQNSFAGATGLPTYISFNNIYSITGELFEKGNRFSLTKSAENLENLIVYPQPANDETDVITFANVTPETKIKILGLNGDFVVDLKEENRDGGIQWDMKDARGNKVVSGIYIFYATNNNESKMGKIAIVR